MSEPFLGEVKLVSFSFAPKGWTQCNGQLLPINQNAALFSLLGTTFGGDGRVNFGLPDLRSRIPVHMGGNFPTLGARSGEEFHTLTLQELPSHNHFFNANSSGAAASSPVGAVYADTSATQGLNPYKSGGAVGATMDVGVIPGVGGNQPHENRQPFLVLNWIIALQGIFPSRN